MTRAVELGVDVAPNRLVADGTDQPCLYLGETAFPYPDGKASFYPLEYVAPCEEQNETYDLHVNNGRLLEHFHEGNLTYRTLGIAEKTPDTFVEVSPELAKERNLTTGSWVQLTSRYGKIRVRAVVTDRVHGKELYVPMNSVENPINRLTSSYTDPVTHTPAFKEVAVKMTVLGEVGESPLPRTNSRWGHPTPQRGVEVERKWQRPDYRLPGPKLIQIQSLRAR